MNYQILKIRLSQIIECIDRYTSEPSIMVLLKESKKALTENNLDILEYIIKELILWYQNNITDIHNNPYVTNFDVHLNNMNILQELLQFVENDDFVVSSIEENSIVNNKNTTLDRIMTIINRFHLIVKQLKHRYNSRETIEINDEYDVQDLLHALLYIYFDDIRAEEWSPSYAGKCSRQDFLLKKHNIVIEVKKTRKGLSSKELGDQLIVDIARYTSHPNCKILICFIYDPEERILNPIGIEKDLTSSKEGLNVIVKIIQK